MFFRQHEKLLSGIILSLSIILIWLWVYNRTSLIAWQTPLGYGGDAWCQLSFAKAFMDGDIFPVCYNLVGHLNAPFSANWNDFPSPEEIIFVVMGWIGRVIGLFPSANIMVMLAHLSAGLSFWYVGRKLKYRSAFVFSGAILFAFPLYIFGRNLSHINLAYYWHIPLFLLVTWWTYSSMPVQIWSRKWWEAVAISALTGVFNPYYTAMFLQFLGFAVLLHLARKKYFQIKFPLLLIGVTIASFLFMNAHTLGYALIHGVNSGAVTRNLASLISYALYIPELIFPPGYHRWHFWADYGQRHYFLLTPKSGFSTGYLGFAGLLGLAWLSVIALYRLLQGKLQLIPVHSWQFLWVLMYSFAGGLNLLLGALGFLLFRATDRYCIVILAIILLFLVRQLSRKCPQKMVIFFAVMTAVIGLWDQLPPKTLAEQTQLTTNLVQSDRRFANELESHLTENGMVFQLPVMPFPEFGPIYQMTDYEHFRPYLFTQQLHYSYGTDKGRGDTDWQNKTSRLAPSDMIAKLESYGFSAIMINRKGYEDNGARLIDGFKSADRSVIADEGDLIAFQLNPSSSPRLPVIKPYQPDVSADFNSGFYEMESSGTYIWRWASSDAILTVSRPHLPVDAEPPDQIEIQFDVEPFGARTIWMEIDGTSKTMILAEGQQQKKAVKIIMPCEKLSTEIRFSSDRPAELPGNGDSRPLAFRLLNLKMVQMP